MTRREDPGAGEPLHAEQAIRRLARMAMPEPGRDLRRQREVVKAIAGDLRRAVASGAASPEVAPRALALACVVSRLAPGTDQDLADLRLFARVSLRECADLLCIDRDSLRQRWRVLRVPLFRRARSSAGAKPQPGPSLPS